MQKRLREVQAERDAMRSEKTQLEREAADVKTLARREEFRRCGGWREPETAGTASHDLKDQLFQAQADLSRERQSRDDVQMLC